MEPIRQGGRDYCVGFRADAAAGIRLRHDHGSQYLSDDFQAESAFLGMKSSPAFVRQPEGKRLRRAVHPHAEGAIALGADFPDSGGVVAGAGGIRDHFNRCWIVERLGYLTPAQARQQLLAQGVAA